MLHQPVPDLFSRAARCAFIVSATAGSMASPAASPRDAAAPLRLFAEGYSVEHPADKHWSCQSPGPVVRCEALFGGLMATPNRVELTGERAELEPREWRLSEDAAFDAWVAHAFCWSDAEGIDRGRLTLEDRSFRYVRYWCEENSIRVYADHLAWFPENFARTHVYYRFLETRWKRSATGAIDAMARSLRLDDPVAAATGPDGELLRAAVNGDADAVARALADGASPDARAGRDGALAGAAFYGHAAIVRALVDAGANVDGTKDDMERPPLVAAISGGEVAIARALVEWGADVKARPARGRTPITAAAESDQVATLRLLVERGAPVDELDAGEPPRSPGARPLARAAMAGHVEAVRTLLELGADPNQPSVASGKANVLVIAAWNDDREIAALLLAAGAEIDHRPPEGRTALHVAVARRKAEMARFLLEKGADPDIDDGEETPLQTAASADRDELVKLLLDAAADPNLRVAGSERTAWSVTKPTQVTVRRLLREAGAVANEPAAPSARVPMPLHQAAEKGDLEGIRRALAAGADVNARDGSNDTPLAVAIFWNEFDAAVLLLEHEADPNAPGTHLLPPLFDAALHPAPDAVRALLAHGADARMTRNLGWTALHYAAMGRQLRTLRGLEGTQGFLVVIDALVDAGADVNASTRDGATPLHLAANNDEGEIIRRLLARGANPQARDSDGWTPLDVARQYGRKSAVAALESTSDKSKP